MKKLIIIIIACAAIAYCNGQRPNNYTVLGSTAYDYTQPGAFSKGLALPAASSAPHWFPLQWTREGSIYTDSTAHKTYIYYSTTGWTEIGTGSGESLFVRQVFSSGSIDTVDVANSVVTVDFTATKDTFTILLPSSPTDMQEVQIEAGGTLLTGVEINSLNIIPNAGQTIVGVLPNYLFVGDKIRFRYRLSTTQWFIL